MQNNPVSTGSDSPADGYSLPWVDNEFWGDDYPDDQVPGRFKKAVSILVAAGAIGLGGVAINELAANDGPADQDGQTQTTHNHSNGVQNHPNALAQVETDEPTSSAEHLATHLEERANLTQGVQSWLDPAALKRLDPDEARKQLSKSDESNPTVRGLESKIIDLADAADAVTDSPDVGLKEVANVQDPDIKQRVEAQINKNLVDSEVNTLSTIDPQSSIDSIKDLPADIRPLVRAGYQKVLVEKAINEASYNPEAATATCSFIDDPAVKDKLAHLIDLKNQIDSLFQASNYVHDTYYSLKNQIDGLQDELHGWINTDTNPTEGFDVDQAKTEIIDLNNEISKHTTTEVKAHNNFEALPFANPALPELSERNARINLAHVKGVKNLEKAEPDDPVAYSEFAQIYMEDGQIKLKVHEGANLSEDAERQIRAVMKHAEPLLQAGFASGDLSLVRLAVPRGIIAKDDITHEGSYDPQTREELIGLPQNNNTSVDLLALTFVHESAHALVRSAYSLEQVTPEMGANVAKACTALKDAAYNRVESSLQTYPERLQGLMAQAHPEHQVVIQKLIDAVASGTFEKLIFDPNAEQGEDSEYGMVLNNCTDFSFFNALVTAADQAGVVRGANTFDYLSQSEEFSKFMDEWNFTMGFGSIYKKLNESNFVDTVSEIKEYVGHSEENATEAMATITDDALNYTEQLKVAMAEDMNDEERAATIQTLRATVDIIVANHPSLTGLMSEVEANILAS